VSNAKDVGYEFTLELCEAIARATIDAKARDAAAFTLRGADLAYVVERELYVRLINDDGVRALYEAHRVGKQLPALSLGAAAEQAVVERLIPKSSLELSLRRAPTVSRLRRTAHMLAGRTRAWRPDISALPNRPILFLLHHQKFLRFVEPVLAHLGPDSVVVASSAGDLSPGSVPAVRVFAWPQGRTPAHLRGFDAAPIYAALHELFSALSPRAVLVVEGNHPWDEAANRAARQLHVPCLCLQHGWSPIVHNGFRNMTFTELLVWGDGFAELLAPFNPDERFRSVGDPAFDAAAPVPEPGRKAVTFFVQAPSQLLAEDNLEEFRQLIRAFAERFPGTSVIVREHPGWPLAGDERARLEACPNVVLAPPSTHSLPDLLALSIASVSAYSTTILESIAALVPPIIFNTTSMPRYSPDVDAAGAGRETRSRAEALEELAGLVKDPVRRQAYLPAMESFRARFFGELDGKAGARVADALAEAADPDRAI
jgi:hypothetical protein